MSEERIVLRMSDTLRFTMYVNTTTRRSEFETYPLTTGDTLPTLHFTVLNNDDTPFNLDGWVPKFFFKKYGLGNATNVDHPNCVIEEAVSGTCKYEFKDGDIADEGLHMGELKLVQDTKILSLPYVLNFQVRQQIH